MNKFELYNNDAIIAMLVYYIVGIEKKIDIAVIALLLPILTNDFLVKCIVSGNENFENILALHHDKLINYNSQFEETLSILIRSISLLIDLKLLDINGVTLSVKGHIDKQQNDSVRLCNMEKASAILLSDIKNHKISNLYKRLKVVL